MVIWKRSSALLGAAERPILVLGADVWADSAEHAALRLVDDLAIPVITNGMGRGVIPRGHRMLVTKARSMAYGSCDLAIVVGTPLDFRLDYGRFGGKDDAPPAQVVHIADAANELATHRPLDGSAAGDLTTALDAHQAYGVALGEPPTGPRGCLPCRLRRCQAAVADKAFLESHASPDHPARVYGELLPLLDDDSVVIGDGGDFVSFAGASSSPRALAVGSTRVRMDVSAPVSARPSGRGSRDRRPRSCCCSATARPACR